MALAVLSLKTAAARAVAVAARRGMASAPLKVGDALPAGTVAEGGPTAKVSVRDLFQGKRGILFGLPGAFSPTCSKVCVAAALSRGRGCRSLARVRDADLLAGSRTCPASWSSTTP